MHITWDEYFMSVAYLSSLRSKDPNTKVGACIVNTSNRIIGVGYNGFPNGCSDSSFPWEREGGFLDTKYAYVVHAEVNAILNATVPVVNATLYATLFPCNECAKHIIQSGIKEVVYYDDKYNHTESCIASMKMFESAGVKMRKYTGHITMIECKSEDSCEL